MTAAWVRRMLDGKQRDLPGRGRPLRLREVLFLSVSLLLIGGYFLGGAIGDYVQMRQFDDWWSRGAHPNELFARRVHLAMNGPRATMVSHKLDPEANDAAVVRIDVPKDQWAALQRDKQETWGVWLDVGLLRGDVPSPVRIRRRGDTSLHWTTEKMSFTMRTPGSERFRGFRTLAFSMADVLPQYVALALAQDFGLLAPYTAVAPVFVNGRYYGIYQVTETIDDDFLTRHERLPGVIYQGDAAERGDVYPGVPRGLFMNPYIWEFAAGDDDGAPADRGPLIDFIQDLNERTFESHLRLMDRLDRDEIARYVSLMLIAGDPYHMDNLHNQFWYADPAAGTLHPIPWDLRLLDLSKAPIWVNEFLRAVLRDPFMVDAVLRETNKRLEQGIVEHADRMARRTYQRFRPHFEYDHLRASVISDVGSPEDVVMPLRRNAGLLRKWANDARLAVHESAAGDVVILDLESRGYAGTDLLGFDAAVPIDVAQTSRVFADRNRNGRLDAADPVLVGRWVAQHTGTRFVLGTPEALLAGWDTRGKGIAAGALHYRYFVRAGSSTAFKLQPVTSNRITGRPATLLAWQDGAARTATLSWNPWQFPTARGSRIRWAGNVELWETLRLSAADTLEIAAGTTVRLHPDVSVIAKGPVQLTGQADAPVRFVPAVANRPWGAFALQGPGSDGSILRFVEFSGGGGATVDGVPYTAMVNLHRSQGVVLDDVTLQDNIRSDDALRIAHGTAVVRRCKVANTNGDGISFEYAGGEVSGCRFEGIAEDALELNGSSPRVFSNQVISATNRGLAINGHSEPLVVANKISGVKVGIEVRGGAEPLLLSNQIAKNQIGLRENATRGMGGWAKLIENVIAENVSDSEVDQLSRLTETSQPTAGGHALRDALLQVAGLNRGSNNFERVDHQEFEEDFTSISDGWVAVGGSLRLDKRAGRLLTTLESRRGGMARAVNWKLAGDSALLVLELSGRDITNVTVTAVGHAGESKLPVNLIPVEMRYTYVALRIPPGEYSELRIEATPQRTGWEIDPRTGFKELRRSRLELASFQLFARPQLTAGR